MFCTPFPCQPALWLDLPHEAHVEFSTCSAAPPVPGSSACGACLISGFCLVVLTLWFGETITVVTSECACVTARALPPRSPCSRTEGPRVGAQWSSTEAHKGTLYKEAWHSLLPSTRGIGGC